MTACLNLHILILKKNTVSKKIIIYINSNINDYAYNYISVV